MIGALSLSMASCDMNQEPSNGTDFDKAWNTVEDVMKFRTGMYSLYMKMSGGIYDIVPDIQSDLFNASIGFGNNRGDMYRWDFSASQRDIEGFWKNSFSCILEANGIINNIGKVEDNVTSSNLKPEDITKELATLKNIKGEAHLMRAVFYHSLVIRFAKDYNPSTAVSELGLPIVIKIDVKDRPKRASLQETYEFIKGDIAEARKLLTVEGKANTNYFSVDVIDALEARVNLYMHKFDDAIKIADKLVGKYPLVTTEEAFHKQWLNDESSELIFNNFASEDERYSSYGHYLSYNTKEDVYNPYYIPSAWVVDLYEDEDLRSKEFFLKHAIISYDVRVDDVFLFNKYPGNPSLKKQDHDYYHMGKPFRIAELYLIAAESAYMNQDEGTAKKWLNNLRTARGASEITSSGDTLFEEIKEEWVREFIGEGMRIDQLKRWGDGFTRKGPQNNEIVMQGDKNIGLVIPANNEKFVWEIPTNDLSANTNLEPNWKQD